MKLLNVIVISTNNIARNPDKIITRVPISFRQTTNISITNY